MTTNRPNPKYGGANVIIEKVYVGGYYFTLHLALSINPSYHHTGQTRSIKIMQETEKQLLRLLVKPQVVH